MTPPPTNFERRLPFERVRNFRDLGGYETAEGRRVRWRTVFRSSSLSETTPADVQRLLDLDLALVLDLRTAEELERTGVSALHEHGVEHRHVPYGRVTMRAHDGPGLDYLRGIEGAVAAIGKVFAAIAEAGEGQAVAFNCEGGKDRTGVTCGPAAARPRCPGRDDRRGLRADPRVPDAVARPQRRADRNAR